MSQLHVGFSRIDVMPPRGIAISGYYVERFMDGVLDELTATAVYLENGGKEAVLVSIDNVGICADIMDGYRDVIAKASGISREGIFLHCTHTHTGPYVEYAKFTKFGGTADDAQEQLINGYRDFLSLRLRDVVLSAKEDASPARMGFASSRASGIAFLRRYKMKDGSVRTNPGVNNPDIIEPVGVMDDQVGVVRFDREGKESVALVNFANHADVVGGCKISADWPGFFYRTVEQALDNTRCMILNGAEGDVNHVNVHPTKGYLNDLFMDFDDVARGYGHARHMGRLIAGSVLQVWDKVEYTDDTALNFMERKTQIPSNRPLPEELPEAKRINDLHLAGHDADLPFKGMMLTTAVADAARKVKLENGPDFFPMSLIAVSIGKIGLVGIPGEPFNRVGGIIKETPGYELIMPCCLTNGSEGYFPMRDSYEQGGYEACSSVFKSGTAELIAENGQQMLAELIK